MGIGRVGECEGVSGEWTAPLSYFLPFSTKIEAYYSPGPSSMR
jgi:hypothetical protein